MNNYANIIIYTFKVNYEFTVNKCQWMGVLNSGIQRIMKKHLPVEPRQVRLEIKSRNGYLSETVEKKLSEFIKSSF